MTLNHLYICSRSDVSPEEWDTAAAKFKSAWFWHNSFAIDGYATWDNHQDISFAIRNSEKQNSIIAIIPLLKIKTIIPLINRLESTGGVAFCDALTPKETKSIYHLIKSTIKELSKEHNAIRIDFSISPLSPLIRTATWPMINPITMLGANESSTMSWLVDLSKHNIEELWQNVAHRTRKAVKKSRGLNYSIREAQPSDVNEYMRLHLETAKRTKLPQKPRAYAENIFENLIPKGLAKVFLAVNDGRVEAFHSFALYKNAANYWTTGCSSKALRDGVNNFLLWEALCVLKAENIDWLECGESLPNSENKKLQRINDFKRGFGGELFPYYRGHIIAYPVLNSILSVFRALKLKVMN